MGFFDFLKKNKHRTETENDIKQPLDNNSLLLNELQKKILNIGYKVEKHPKYLSLIINDELEVATFIIENPEYHPNILHLMILTIHKVYFPHGIEENIVGAGINMEEKIESVLNNYLSTTFEPTIESFTDSHNPNLDFYNNDILWHPKLGNLALQGTFNNDLKNEQLYSLLNIKLKEKMTPEYKYHWLKIYISKRKDGDIIGECLFDNNPWEEGLEIINKYAENWSVDNDFIGMKQFIMFRKCDKYD
ncbi:DUF6348 family protein [Chryseobacterium oryctis]|uniref:DUF6348 family protein n=1 Tax=Chryseobacterium oryctis TaxID=2952618 RepID=A0ABT3HK64_9FLAO|nr:DUF6348 family protein [Chryseobacterium oryctis]MCW3160179.1 DUF6348 family protein [Chryseobacterium oryctis]